MRLSKRIQKTPSSPIRKFAKLEKQAIKKGIKVFRFNIGQPDMDTPNRIRETFKHFEGKVVLYADSRGIPECLHAWQKYYLSHGIKLAEEDIIVTSGGSEAVLFSFLATADPGDEIICPEPFYTNYAGFAAMADIKLVPVTLTREHDFQLGSVIEEIKQRVTDKTRAVIICNPNNPSGAVYSSEDLQQLVDIALENNLYIISDEVYREFIFNGEGHKSILDFPEIRDRAILIDSVSKRFNHCGGRVGCIVSRNRELMDNILKFAQARLAVPTLEQLSVVPLLNEPKEYTDLVRKEYKKRRDIIYNVLKDIPGVECILPKGSFYILAKLPVHNAEDFVAWLLEKFSHNNETVMVTPAQDFYLTPGLGKNEIRIAYVLNEKDTIEAMEILKIGLEVYTLK